MDYPFWHISDSSFSSYHVQSICVSVSAFQELVVFLTRCASSWLDTKNWEYTLSMDPPSNLMIKVILLLCRN